MQKEAGGGGTAEAVGLKDEALAIQMRSLLPLQVTLEAKRSPDVDELLMQYEDALGEIRRICDGHLTEEERRSAAFVAPSPELADATTDAFYRYVSLMREALYSLRGAKTWGEAAGAYERLQYYCTEAHLIHTDLET